ncbi:MAG: zinc metallopeptidase [Oscillatoriales cyanobacterium RM2_1_1]|nr:zinc metallopeptidase [Oscillatoriales cyanobacterium SM2_3_0]NJO44873.1 zinc metallopeptidase [Oscillatoriales cyanobacterium RM2_1_1]
MFYFDPTYFLFVALPTLVLSGLVQMYLKSSFAKWSRVPNSERMTGMQVGETLFNKTSLRPIPLEQTQGSLTDHYDPHANVVRLSTPVAGQTSIAAMAVTAHELGHVQQYQTGSPLIGMRSLLLPAIQFSPTISYIAFTLGILFNLTGLMWVGVVFFGFMVVFSLLTLPVELDASRRGLALLKEAGLLDTQEEVRGARQVLSAAALTYLAAAITSVMQLLYYINLIQRNRRYN